MAAVTLGIALAVMVDARLGALAVILSLCWAVILGVGFRD